MIDKNKTENLELDLLRGDAPADFGQINAGITALDRMLADYGTLQPQIDTIAADLGSHNSNCRMLWGSYVGTGTCGGVYSIRLECGFYPVAAIFYSPMICNNGLWAVTMVRGMPSAWVPGFTGRDDLKPGAVTLIWGDTYLLRHGNDPHQHLDSKGREYYYVIWGVG